MIQTQNLCKEFGHTTAVDELNLSVDKGEIFGLLGPNGAGKTTTIRMLASLLDPTRGGASIAGIDVLSCPEKVHPIIGYVPDFYGMPDGLLAWEYLDYFAQVYRIECDRRIGRVNEVLDTVKLSERKNTYVGAMSRGMKQRLCVAKALLHDPEVLLLDEPTSGLDPESRIDLRRILRLLQRSGKTILISSHLLVDLTGFCTSLGIMDDGRLLEAGPIDELQKRYQRHRSLRLVVVLGIDAVGKLLFGDQNVVEHEIDGNEVLIRYKGTIEDMADLNARLNSAGIRIASFSEEEETIEQIFMGVTESLGSG